MFCNQKKSEKSELMTHIAALRQWALRGATGGGLSVPIYQGVSKCLFECFSQAHAVRSQLLGCVQLFLLCVCVCNHLLEQLLTY